MKIFRSIRAKLTISFVAVLLMSVVSLGIMGLYLADLHLKAVYMRELKISAENVRENVEAFIERKKDLVNRIAEGHEFHDYTGTSPDHILLEYLGIYHSDFPVISYINREGFEEVKIIHDESSRDLNDYGGSEFFQKVFWSPNELIIERLWSLNLNASVISISTAKHIDDKFVGILRVEIPAGMLSEYIKKYKVGKSGFVSLIDEGGYVVASSQKEFNSENRSVPWQMISGLNSLEQDYSRGTLLGIDSLYAYTFYKQMGWTVLVALPYSEIRLIQKSQFLPGMLAASLIFAVGIFISTYLSRKLSDPINRAAFTADMIAQGDFSHKMSVESYDELGVLGRSFNGMIDKINDTQIKLQKAYVDVELQVIAKTAELLDTNRVLEAEMAARQQNDEKISYLAYHDSMTGLPNRFFFEQHLNKVIADSEINRDVSAVLFMDVDDFKRINDTLGHIVGDRLLMKVAARLRKSLGNDGSAICLKSNDLFARMGADEFMVILTELSDVEEAAMTARHMIRALAEPFRIKKREIYINMSIGIAISPRDGTDVVTILRHADTAMYHAKRMGKNCFHYYEEFMDSLTLGKLSIESDLRKALINDELVLYYQPQLDAVTKKVVGLEALIRWNHPERGLVPPLDFIPLAEENGMIIPITDWVVENACRQKKLWAQEGLTGFTVSVNLSGHHFQQKGLLGMIKSALKNNGLSPEDILLEITETTLMANTGIAHANIHDLIAMGMQLVIDDFGTGYSSLSYLKRLAIYALKIDRSFIMDLVPDSDDAAIVKAIIVMAQSLNIKVVAEGVETEEQSSFLSSSGCDELQGLLYSKPVPANEIVKLLKKEIAFDI